MVTNLFFPSQKEKRQKRKEKPSLKDQVLVNQLIQRKMENRRQSFPNANIDVNAKFLLSPLIPAVGPTLMPYPSPSLIFSKTKSHHD
jgi:hypothetical protein